MKCSWQRLPLMLVLFILSLPTSASENKALEQAALAQIVKELNFILRVVDEGEAARQQNGRIIFDYVSLRKDLEKVRNAINNHLNRPLREPRRIVPLVGKYSKVP